MEGEKTLKYAKSFGIIFFKKKWTKNRWHHEYKDHLLIFFFSYN